MIAKSFALKLAVALLLSLLCAAPGVAQDKNKTAALKEEIQKRFGEKVDIRFDQPYAGNENPRQMLDLYLPKQPASSMPLPVIVYIHGGGWSGGDRKGFLGAAAQQAAGGNYAAIAVGYRLSGEAKWPAQIHDCKAAIRWIRAHAKELNLDPDHFGCTGGSAGGHLVALLGVTSAIKTLDGDLGEHTNQSSAVHCVVNYCGPTDLAQPLMQGDAAKQDDPVVVALLGGSLESKREQAKEASPLTYVSEKSVPIMSVHGTQDLRVNFTHSEQLDAALKKAGVKSYLIPMVNAGHGLPTPSSLTSRVQKFWDLNLRGIESEISTEPIVVPVQPPAKK